MYFNKSAAVDIGIIITIATKLPVKLEGPSLPPQIHKAMGPSSLRGKSKFTPLTNHYPFHSSKTW